jgi:hypothetical protein
MEVLSCGDESRSVILFSLIRQEMKVFSNYRYFRCLWVDGQNAWRKNLRFVNNTSERAPLILSGAQAWLRKIHAAAAPLGKCLPLLNGIAAVIVLVVTLIAIFPEVRGMATTSLWNDEIYSIQNFSSKGPGKVLTDLHAPNNHLFFNLLNSVTPASDSLYPARARLWSFLATAALGIVIAGHYLQLRQPLVGAMVLFLIMANLTNLDTMLQARGYGFLALGAALCCHGVVRYFQRGTTRDIILVAVAVWLATWSVPSFVFFGGPLLLLVTFATRDLRWLWAGMGCLALIVLSYWVVQNQMLENAVNYEEKWGLAFKDWDAVSIVLQRYLLFEGPPWVAFLFAAALIVGAQSLRWSRPEEQAALLLGAAVLAAWLICLIMRTPIPRSVAFIVVPISFLAAQILQRIIYRKGRVILPIVGTLILTGAILWQGGHSISTFTFTPIENWLGTARRIERDFPHNTLVLADFRPMRLGAYLKGSDYPMVKTFDREQFLRGQLIVVDSSFYEKDRWDTSGLPSGYRTVQVPQRRGDSQKIYCFP